MAVLYRCFWLFDTLSNHRWHCKVLLLYTHMILQSNISGHLCIVCTCSYHMLFGWGLGASVVYEYILFISPGTLHSWRSFSWHSNNWSGLYLFFAVNDWFFFFAVNDLNYSFFFWTTVMFDLYSLSIWNF